MKKMIMIVLVLVLGVAVFAACNCEKNETNNTLGKVDLTSADNDKTIEVAIDAGITITLAENQTTPVHWQDKPEQVGDATISDVTSEYLTDPNPDGKMGVGGKRVFSFSTKSAGTVKLTFTAAHIADSTDVYDKFEVTLTVK